MNLGEFLSKSDTHAHNHPEIVCQIVGQVYNFVFNMIFLIPSHNVSENWSRKSPRFYLFLCGSGPLSHQNWQLCWWVRSYLTTGVSGVTNCHRMGPTRVLLAKVYWKILTEKLVIFIPFEDNLTHFWPKSDTPALPMSKVFDLELFGQ